MQNQDDASPPGHEPALGLYKKAYSLEELIVVGRRKVLMLFSGMKQNAKKTPEEWDLVEVTFEKPLPTGSERVFSFFFEPKASRFFFNEGHSLDFVQLIESKPLVRIHYTLMKNLTKNKSPVFLIPLEVWHTFLGEQYKIYGGDVEVCAKNVVRFISTMQKQVKEDFVAIAAATTTTHSEDSSFTLPTYQVPHGVAEALSAAGNAAIDGSVAGDLKDPNGPTGIHDILDECELLSGAGDAAIDLIIASAPVDPIGPLGIHNLLDESQLYEIKGQLDQRQILLDGREDNLKKREEEWETGFQQRGEEQLRHDKAIANKKALIAKLQNRAAVQRKMLQEKYESTQDELNNIANELQSKRART